MTDMSVPLLDLKAQYAGLRDEIEPAIRRVVEDQMFIGGPEVTGLEAEIAAYVGAAHAVACSSGSDAIILALDGLLIGCNGGHNGRVLCPAYTFFATAGSCYRLGAIPVFCDIDPVTFNADLDHAREVARRTPKLAALMPVHLFGRAVDMDGWLALGRELGVPVIEDAAQAIGTRDGSGAMVGSRSEVTAFSFFPSKNLGGFGDGGILTTNDAKLAARMRELRNHGMEPKYFHHSVGINGRLDALQAAVLRVKLRHLESWHAARIANAARYDALFAAAGVEEIITPAGVEPPARHIYNQYVVRVPEALRDPLRAHLSQKKIGHEVYYPLPLHLQSCFAMLGYQRGDLPESESAARQTLALPVYPEITEAQQRYVVQTIAQFVGAGVTAGA